jgi:hypothetical protein
MAQTVNYLRSSLIAPIAAVIIVAGFILYFTKRINGACFAMLVIGTGLFMLVLYPIATAVQNSAQAVACLGQQQIIFSNDQVRKAKFDLWFLVASGVILLLQAILAAFEVVRFLHGH